VIQSEPVSSDDPAALQAMLAAERVENERLRKIIRELQRHRFGRRAESLPVDQLLLGLEEAEQAEAADEAKAEAAAPAERSARVAKRRANRGALPSHLPRIETLVDIEDRSCPCCAAPLHRVGEDVSERLDVWCRRSSGCWWCAGRNTPAGPARTACPKPPRRRD